MGGECIIRLQLSPLLPRASALPFPIRADSFDHKLSLCTTTALFAFQPTTPSVGTSSYNSSEHFFFGPLYPLWFFFSTRFSALVEVLLRRGFGIYQCYVSYWNNGGLHEKNELFCMKILAKPYFPLPFYEQLLSFEREYKMKKTWSNHGFNLCFRHSIRMVGCFFPR